MEEFFATLQLVLYYLAQLAQTALTVALPILVAYGVNWLKAKRTELKNSEYADELAYVEMAASQAVWAAEQLGLKTKGMDKLNYATGLAQAWLDQRGIAISATTVRGAIEAALAKELNHSKMQ